MCFISSSTSDLYEVMLTVVPRRCPVSAGSMDGNEPPHSLLGEATPNVPRVPRNAELRVRAESGCLYCGLNECASITKGFRVRRRNDAPLYTHDFCFALEVRNF